MYTQSDKAAVTPGLITFYDYLRWVNFGVSGAIVRNRATLNDVSAIEEPRTTSWWFSVMSKNLATCMIPGIVGHRDMNV